MKKNLLRLVLYCALAYLPTGIAAQDSSHLRISLLTCSPGEELYSTFGHSAFRVVDSSSVTDYVFNFGTFNFDDEGFYLKFIRGKLNYYLSAENFQDFRYDYQMSNRGIFEQVLNLTATEKIAMQQALLKNIREENKYYKYDFFFDNCTTRPRDMIVQTITPHPALAAVMPAGTKFRQAIHKYLIRNNKYWSKLGIDLLLGAPTDAVMTTSQSQFLPEVLMTSLENTNQQQQVLLSSTNLYPINNENNKPSPFRPSTIFSCLLVLFILMSVVQNKWATIFMQGFDGIFLFLTGAIGILLIFMWTATDHAMCKENYNLLWALPTNCILAFFVNSKKKSIKKYFGLTAILLCLTVIFWFFLPQQMNNGFLPIVFLLINRTANKYFS
jgi:hypothetical protein